MKDWDELDEEKSARLFVRVLSGLLDLIKLGGEGKRLKIIIFLIIMGIGLDVGFNYILKLIFDELPRLIEASNGVKTGEGEIQYLVILGVGLVTTTVTALLIHNRARMPLYFKTLIKLENFWPMVAQDKLLALSQEYHQKQNIGQKSVKIEKGVEKLVSLLDYAVNSFFPHILYFVLNITMIVVVDWKLGALFLPAIYFAVYKGIKDQEKYEKVWDRWEKLKEKFSGHFCESLLLVRTVQGYVQESQEKSRTHAIRDEMREIDIDSSIDQQLTYYFPIGASLQISFSMIIAVGAFFVYKGMSTVGSVVFVIAAGQSSIHAVWELLHVYNRMMRNGVSVLRMKELLDTPIDLDPNEEGIVPSETEGKIDLKNVSFRYGSEGAEIIKSCTLTILPGQMVAFVGKTGAGKSTLTDLIALVRKVTDGEIQWNGENINNLQRNWYRKKIARVNQIAEIFALDIWGNIIYIDSGSHGYEWVMNQIREGAHNKLLGDKSYLLDNLLEDGSVKLETYMIHLAKARYELKRNTHENVSNLKRAIDTLYDVLVALKDAQIGRMFEDKERFPRGLATKVGEKGVRLSGGEKQRLEIARALFAIRRGAKVLILDEATASVDSQTEKEIQEAIEDLKRAVEGLGLTIIVIAHRLSTVKQADKIFEFEDGVLVHQGTHEELMAHGGYYAKAFSLQNGSKIKEEKFLRELNGVISDRAATDTEIASLCRAFLGKTEIYRKEGECALK